MRIKIAAEMKRAGVPISDDWFYETTGIPKPDNYNELKQQQEEARQAAAQAMQQPDEKEKPEKGKKDGKKLTESVEDKAAEYLTRLEKFTEKMNSFFGEALP
jgi:phage gp29-like protein